MTFTRDSVIWTIGLIGGIASALAANWHLFPWVPINAQHWVSLAGFIAAIISGKLATSPLQISPDGHRQEVLDHNLAVDEAVTKVQEMAKAPPIPPVAVVVEKLP